MEKGNYQHVLQSATHKKNDQPPTEPADSDSNPVPVPKPEEPEDNTQEQS